MILSFEDCELDIGRVELRRDGIAVPIEPQVFALLRLLIERRERIVTHDDLIASIWGGRIVSDTAISSRIKSARAAIGDDGASQRLIRTVRGHGFRFVGTIRDAPPRAAEVAAVMARPLVAILPLRHAAAEAADRYLAEGVAEALAAELAAWRWFPILSRHAAGEAPGVRYAIGGSLNRLGDRARLTIELTDVASGLLLWTATFEDRLPALIAIQAGIATELFRRIAPELQAAERRRVARAAPADPTAWDLTVQALAALNEATRDGIATALGRLEAATRLDPEAALPWSLTALARFEAGLLGWTAGDMAGARGRFEQMLAAARHAIALDPNGWMGHSLASAGEMWAASSYDRARFHADEALRLHPSAGLAHHLSGCIFGFGGEPAEAIAVQGHVRTVDPHYRHGAVIDADLGLWHFLLGELDVARHHLQRALAAQPGNVRAQQRLAAVLGRAGEREAARTALAALARTSGLPAADYVAASYPFQRPEHATAFADGLRAAGLNL